MTETVSANEARKLTDATAERLEEKGLWRRAATRWLEVMYLPGCTDKDRASAAVRRNHCQRMATGSKPLSHFVEV